MKIEVDVEGSFAVANAVQAASRELDELNFIFQRNLNELNAARGFGPVNDAVKDYGETVLMPDLQALGQRISNAVGGAKDAVGAYVAADAGLARDSVWQADSLASIAPPSGGLGGSRFLRQEPVSPDA